MCLLWIGEGMQIFIFFYLPKALNDDWGTPADDVAWIDGDDEPDLMMEILVAEMRLYQVRCFLV